LLVFGLALISAATSSVTAYAQGCIPARFMALSLGPDGIVQLRPGEWQVGASFRYLYADEGWRGTDPWPEYATIVGNQITVITTDFQATYAFDSRYSATLTVPYTYGKTSNFADHGGVRHAVSARGLGDVRFVASAWVLDPESHRNGNISLGVGVKAPTGEQAATGIFYRPSGPKVLPVDSSIQPGDGGWGVMIEAAGFRRLSQSFYAYANGYYLINPREQNRAHNSGPEGEKGLQHSVPDQYLGRAGIAVALGASRQFSLNLGGRINGLPAHDLVGGNEGFRRPGYAVYYEPGLTWTGSRNTFSLFVPLRADANRTRNIYDIRNGSDGGGAFARYLIVTGFSRRL
jgi:hypothetical protein